MFSYEELEQYNRHLRIDRIGIKGQENLKNSDVLVVGAGGLGSPILLYLASVGVGRIGILDGDKVSRSNLNRQILYTTEDIEKNKSLVARDKLQKLNPFIKIESFSTQITNEAETKNIFSEFSAIIDATDNYETRYLINRVAINLNKPLFIGAVGRFVGQATVVIPYKTACFNCIFPEKDPKTVEKLTQTNRERGILGTVVGVTGTIVANEFIKYTLGIGELLTNKLFIFNALNNEFSIVKLEKDPKCKVCGNK